MTKETEPAEKQPVTIHECMIAILRDLDAITKSRTAGTGNFKYNFRGIDQVYNAINPLLCKYGVYMTAKVMGSKREEREKVNDQGHKSITAFTTLHMLYTFHAADGSKIETEASGEGMDSGDKSSNKAMSVAHKYAILQAFCVPTEDIIDPDSEIPAPVAPRQSAPKPDTATAPPAQAPTQTNPRIQQAADWCHEAIELIKGFDTSTGIAAWLTRSEKTRKAAADLAPVAYKELEKALAKRQAAVKQPIAAE